MYPNLFELYNGISTLSNVLHVFWLYIVCTTSTRCSNLCRLLFERNLGFGWSMLDGWDIGLGLPRTPHCGAGARPLQNKGGAKGRGRDNCVPQHQSQELRTGFGPRGSSPPPHNHLHRTSFVNDSFPLNSNFEPVFDLLRHRLGSLGNGDVGWRSVPGLVRNRCRRSIDWNSTPLRIALTARRFEYDPFSYVR